ncbi:hypothetical protein [Providencia rettgeri]|uniref:hypothetical protein n=1 Tax=Providencia rettgeri TaxID=587 RepID=UPI0024BA9DAE|nr:hypothetical protein [Providencia rettgeri]WHT81893.1 hypothetical protein KOL65_21905 [Providencia rettgeri]
MKSYDYNTALFFSPLFKNTIGVLNLSRYGAECGKDFIISDLSVLEKMTLCCDKKNVITISDITKENSRKHFNGNIDNLDPLKMMGIDVEGFEFGCLYIISSNSEITHFEEEISFFDSLLHRFYETDELDDDVSVLLGLS